LEPKLSDTLHRERAKKMDAIYRGEVTEEKPERSSSVSNETVEESMKKLKDLEGMF
jgi:hypothetical protein